MSEPLVRPSLLTQGAQFVNQIRSQLGVAVSVAVGMPTLGNAVSNILNMRAKEQVRGVHARPIVTAMQHIGAIWDRATVPYPREPVGEFDLSRASTDSPIARFCLATHP
jgi:hypothetical protein